jgi:hypothetical protein
MKLMVGMPIKERAWCLPEWFAALEAQDIEHEVVAIYSPSADETELVLIEHNATIIYDESLGRSLSNINAHCWGDLSTYHYMATMRNHLTRLALEREADYFFSLDSDIILPPNTLREMLKYAQGHPGVIAPAVNMTINARALNVMKWSTTRGHAYRDGGEPPAGKVDVVMAAMLLDRTAMECQWRSHPQGEDVGFCADALDKNVALWWLPHIQCQHLMVRY